MKGYLIVIALCVLGANAIPKPPTQIASRIGGSVPADVAPHACMILAHRVELDGTNTAALGSGSIISTRHVLTAAHLVQRNTTRFQIGFFVGSTRRLLEATFRLIHEDYNSTSFANDIAIVFLQGSATFPLANVIKVSSAEAPPATALTTVGFGFTAANSTGAASNKYASNQEVQAACELGTIEAAETHFCAVDPTPATWVCPGDNGAGCFSGTTVDDIELVGIASRILPGCSEPKHTAYTNVGPFSTWISNITGVPVSTFIANYNKLHNKKN